MSLLPSGRIWEFPVRYPPGTTARTLPRLTTRPLPRNMRGRDLDPRVISFGNSYGHDRPHGGHSGHGAIDIYGAFECSIHAACDGTVVEEWTPGGSTVPAAGVGFMPHLAGGDIRGGNYVMLLDRQGYYHYYAHMTAKSPLRPGDPVAAGTDLGRIGATGLPPGRMQHLHYQVTRRTGRQVEHVDPYAELRRLAMLLGATSTPGGFVTLLPRG